MKTTQKHNLLSVVTTPCHYVATSLTSRGARCELPLQVNDVSVATHSTSDSCGESLLLFKLHCIIGILAAFWQVPASCILVSEIGTNPIGRKVNSGLSTLHAESLPYLVSVSHRKAEQTGRARNTETEFDADASKRFSGQEPSARSLASMC